MAFKATFKYDDTRKTEVMTDGPYGLVGTILDQLAGSTEPIEEITINPNFDPADWTGEFADPVVRDPAS
jgi:hypothetical protein